MIIRDIDDDILKEAKKLAEEMGKIKYSITGGRGNVAGFVGEIMYRDLTDSIHKNTYDYDLITKSGYKVEVKTKRTTTDYVLPSFEASIADFHEPQDCDIYAFARVNLRKKICWLLGWIWKEEYYKKARYLKKGQIDPSNYFKVKANCYNLKYSELYELPFPFL